MRLVRLIAAFLMAVLATLSDFEIVRILSVLSGWLMFYSFLFHTGPRYARRKNSPD